MLDGIGISISIMKTQTDAYSNPLINAQKRSKGSLSGLHRILHMAQVTDPNTQWYDLSAGETRSVPAGAVLQIKGSAGRVHSFLFEEAGSVHGPVQAATIVGAEVQSLLHRPAARQHSVLLTVIVAITLAFAAFLFLIRNDVALWSTGPRAELLATLVAAWAILCAAARFGCNLIDCDRNSTTRIAPPRPRLDRLVVNRQEPG